MMFPAANNALAELAARKSMESNQAQVIVLTTEDFISILQDKAKQNPSVDANLRKVLANSELGKYWNSTVYKNVNDEAWLVPTSQAATDALDGLRALAVVAVMIYYFCPLQDEMYLNRQQNV